MTPPATPHPPPDRLDAFAVGRVGEEELVVIAAHIADCPACCARLERIPTDSMLSQIRSAALPGGEDSEARAAAVRVIRDGLLAPPDLTAADTSRLTGASSGTPNPFSDRATEGGPERIGEYDVEAEVGRGGMGVVYRARHRGLNRPAAVKVILSGRFASEVERRRFRLEAELAAQVRHPNVVQVYEVGVHDGYPYLAMEWVEGGTLADRLDGRPWPPAAAVGLVEAVAAAVQAAHDEGIVHRDLKPANILLQVESRNVESHKVGDRGPALSDFPTLQLDDLRPLVADFGLARSAHGERLTRTGVVGGTPEYMAPEQAAGGGPVGPAADVYALGVVLYRLLAGRPPFTGEDPLSVLAAVVGREPPHPRRFNRTVPRDLEAICLKCLEKKPHRRYETARALADDLARFRARRPVAARRVGAVTRASRWGRRNPGTAALLAALAAAVTTGFGLVTWKWQEADRRRDEAETQTRVADERRREARRNLYVSNVRLAKQAIDQSQLHFAQQLLDEVAAGEPGDDDLRGFEWHYLHRLANPAARTVVRHPAGVVASAATADGRLVASSCSDGVVRVTDTSDGREVFAVRQSDRAGPVAFSADGGRFAVLGPVVQVGETRTWKPIQQFRPAGSTCVALHPDGRQLAASGWDGGVEIWAVDAGERVLSFRAGGEIRGLAYSPDGGRLAVAGGDGVVRVCDAETGAVRAAGPRGPAYPLGIGHPVAFSPDGRTVASPRPDGTLQVVEADTGRVVRVTATGLTGTVTAVAFGPGGGVLAAADASGTVRVWDAATGRPRLTLRGHADGVSGLAVTSDGRVVTASWDRTVVLWEPAGSAEVVALGPPGADVLAVAFSADGQRVAAGLGGGNARVREADTGRELFTVPGHPDRTSGIAFSPDGTRLFTVGHDPVGRVWDAAGGRLLLTLDGHTAPLLGVAVSPDGGRVATAGEDGTARVWDAGTGRPVRVLAAGGRPVSCVAFGPDGRHLAAGSHDGSVRVWAVGSGELVATLPTGAADAVAFSPDGRHLAAAGFDGAGVWDLAGGRPAFALRGHTRRVQAVGYSPDGRRVATAGLDGTLRLWDAADGRELLVLGGVHAGGLAFSPDGRRIVAGSNGEVRMWEAFPLPPELLRRRRLTD
jgi:WD40 repeat protein/serine/threonine protein kinase